jgi:hypothetical protein
MEGKHYLDQIRFISGGQTGIDRALLDFCLDRGVECGGFCPAGRKAEDGPIHSRYPLSELPKASYKKRTAANVSASEATIILYYKTMLGGTLKSYEFVRKEGKPFLLLDMSIMNIEKASLRILKFLEKFQPGIVNFSGPRASEWPEGYQIFHSILEAAIRKKRVPL